LTHEIKEAQIEIDLPNEEWFLTDKIENKITVYWFKRNPIVDNEQKRVIPNIAVLVDDVDEGMDITNYSIAKRTQPRLMSMR
jgi:hypothetical protein